MHCLLGENGAGKSTLMNILYGLLQPGRGRDPDGREARCDSAGRAHAIDLGIGMVHQHFMLIPVFTVAENIVLADEPTRDGILLDIGAAERRVQEICDRYGLAVDPTRPSRTSRSASSSASRSSRRSTATRDILILDEPTAVLTPQEIEELFEVVRQLRDEGKSIIMITHKLKEVLSIADRITVLRRGEMVGTVPAQGATEEIARPDDGRPRGPAARRQDAGAARSDPCCSLRDLWVNDDRELDAVRGVTFEVHAGEIVALAGHRRQRSDRARSTRSRASAASPPARSSVDGENITGASRRTRSAKPGSGHIPEDRQRRGLVLDFDLRENSRLHDWRRARHRASAGSSPRRVRRARARC